MQEQLEENKRRARVNSKGATYLLQGLLVCKRCERAYCGGKSTKRNIKAKDTIYNYYRCTGTDSSRFGGTKLCNSKQVGANAVETVVWEEVKKLLKDPQRIFEEYQRRLKEAAQTPTDHTYSSIDKQRMKLEKSISLLIDSYTQQYITKDEFEPRIKTMRQKLKTIQEQQHNLIEQKNLTKELELIISNLEEFSCGIISKLDSLDWHDKRNMIRGAVKRIEMGEDDINIVYRIPQLPSGGAGGSSQHCCNRTLRS